MEDYRFWYFSSYTWGIINTFSGFFTLFCTKKIIKKKKAAAHIHLVRQLSLLLFFYRLCEMYFYLWIFFSVNAELYIYYNNTKSLHYSRNLLYNFFDGKCVRIKSQNVQSCVKAFHYSWHSNYCCCEQWAVNIHAVSIVCDRKRSCAKCAVWVNLNSGKALSTQTKKKQRYYQYMVCQTKWIFMKNIKPKSISRLLYTLWLCTI